jgi:hypothetical protein
MILSKWAQRPYTSKLNVTTFVDKLQGLFGISLVGQGETERGGTAKNFF